MAARMTVAEKRESCPDEPQESWMQSIFPEASYQSWQFV
jgi:hypothetical protein